LSEGERRDGMRKKKEMNAVNVRICGVLSERKMEGEGGKCPFERFDALNP